MSLELLVGGLLAVHTAQLAIAIWSLVHHRAPKNPHGPVK